ncbi:cation diffusion facilitator family transporter [uncultured Tyzzerella sp.]|uniref:cation diffusion facilitator family transporter n=1 Tax=uncultured Tyzzerella sp. TaxID=2321398 RepID=UPI00294358E0|nr:cation diffusion facilitator family transporter [uncultured Tyzzerella sp.]
MTNLLVKLFIKDYKNIKNENVRTKYGELGSLVGISSNVILFIIKFLVGVLINSVAIMADSFNNLSDSLSSIITLVGFKLGAKPADEEHPFGHGRMEYISGLVVSFIIILIGFEFLRASFFKIINPETISFSYITIFILLITVLIKIWQAMFNKKIGTLINSHSLIATATDSRNDVIVTSVTIVSLIIFKFFNINLDGYFGIFVALFLMYSGFNLAKETLSPLLGEAIDNELAEKIKSIAISYDGVIGVHDILVHNYGPNKSIASLHVEVPSNIDITKSHETIDLIEKHIQKELNIFLTIHMDPVNVNDERIQTILDTIKNVFKNYDDELDTHDHRLVDGQNRINFIFDLVIPYNFSKEKETKLISDIKSNVSALDKRYKCIINIEKSFINK